MKNTKYRPIWTCGRYNAEKHVALMYNLLAGYSYFFESYSADVIGQVLDVPRSGEVDVKRIASTTGIAEESIEAFFDTLINAGLLTNFVPIAGDIKKMRSQLAEAKRVASITTEKTTKEKLPFDTSSAEQDYYNAVDDGKTVTSVMFELTYNCSEQCIHCYNPGATRNDSEVSHRSDRDELDLNDYKRIIDDLCEHGLVKVCLSGGDPFSKPIVWDIIDYLYQKEIAFDVFTNGQRIVDKVERLANYFPRLVGVSIYSGIAEDHDAITRVKGSWERSMKVVEQLSDLAIPMNLKCCIMQPNLHSYYLVADIAKQYGAEPQFEININDSIDGDLCSRQLRLTEEQFQVVLRDDNIPYYVGPEAPGFGGQPRPLDVNGCGAGHTTFCITPDGNFQPCCAFPMPFGNLKSHSVKEILTESRLLKEWRTATLQQYEECGKRDYCAYCNLCAGNNYVEHRDFRKPAENNCTMAKIRCDMAHQMMQGYDSLHGQDFVTALKALPKDKVDLRRMYDTKGINGVSRSTPVTN
jgi:MoaA/NifB/PqqE/SkfB family radical SAM enzyme